MGLNSFDVTGIGSVADLIKTGIDKIWPDKSEAERAQAALLLAQLNAETALSQAQIATNTEEAKSTNWFVAGARPFILWGCGFAMMYAALFEPMARFVSVVVFNYNGTFPVLDTSLTTQVLLGLLGLGGMRTIEKLRGAEGNR